MHVVYRNKEWHLTESLVVSQLLKHLAVLPETVLVVRNGKLVTEDQRLEVGDEVKVVAAISGG